MWDLILKWAVPFICGACVTFVCTLFVRMRAIRAGLQCLLRAEIIRTYDKATDKGFCPLYSKEAITRAYKAYHALGGNDVATELYHETMEMPNEQKKAR